MVGSSILGHLYPPSLQGDRTGGGQIRPAKVPFLALKKHI